MGHIPNLMPFTSDAVFYFYAPTSQPEIVVYHDNGTSGSDAHVFLPNGTIHNIGHTTQDSPLSIYGLLPGTYYFLINASATGIGNIEVNSAPWSADQITNSALQDDLGFALLWSANSGAGVVVQGGGTTVVPANGGANWRLKL